MVSCDTRPQFAGQFLLEVDGTRIGTFSEVTGLEVEVETFKIQEGGQNQFVHEVPGRMSWPRIVLKKGVTEGENLFSWLEKSAGDQFAGNGNKLERASGAITLLDESGERLQCWDLVDVYPAKWKGPTFAAASTDVAEEELELVHHGFTSGKL